ncbi:MAG TPA: protein kinase, partial [Gemmataceae bacterium]|nr:protein kinase [Gemmataceae bacterium]
SGESLQARLDREGPLEAAEVVRIGLQTASGLAAAHAQGLIHRDIKPANLLLEKDSLRVKITDFGLARMSDDVGLTQDGVIAGTPAYMAPEQARGEVVDHRADLFSLGSVLYACCTGKPPFRGSTALAVLSQVNDKEPAPIRSLNPDVPAWLEAFIARLMAKDPDQRFQSAAEAAALLESYLAHVRQPLTVPAPELPTCLRTENSAASFSSPRTRTIKQRLKYAWLPVLLLCLGGLGLSFLLLAQIVPPQQQPPAAKAGLREFYQDFRKSQRLDRSLTLWSADDLGEVSRFEAEGFRVTLPAGRPVNWPVEVATSFALSGDFEVTGTYELLSATRPAKGYGVGIGVNIADSKDRNKFVKMARCLLPKKGSVFQSQYWVNDPRHDFRERMRPTASRIGQLRVVRKGAALRCLAADGLGGDFQEFLSIKEFGTEDMGHVLLGVMDSGPPGFAVDARLLDFKVRAARFVPKADAADQILDFPTGAEPVRKPASRKWLTVLVILILSLLSFLVIVFIVRRRRHSSDSLFPISAHEENVLATTAAPPVSVRCSGCEKMLKLKPDLAGKKIKCPKCGNVVRVPQAESTPFKKPRFSAWIIWLAAPVGLLLVVFLVWLCWPRKSAPSSFLDDSLGQQSVPGVEGPGFSGDDVNASAGNALKPAGLSQEKPLTPEENHKPRNQVHLKVDLTAGIDKLPPSLSLFGPDVESVVKTDSQGWRITLPAGRADPDRVGLQLPRLSGDFSISLGYESLAVGKPLPEYGAGVVMRIWFDAPSSPSAILDRHNMPDGQWFGASKSFKGPKGKEQFVNQAHVKATGARGKLGLVRIGSQLLFLAAEEGQDFKVIHSMEVGDADVWTGWIACQTIYTPIALDVRWTELDIWADRIDGQELPSAP